MAPLRGQRHTGGVSQDFKARDINKKIALINPNEFPFITLLNKVKEVPTKVVEYETAEDDYIPPAVTTAEVVSAGETAITLATDEAKYVFVEDALFDPATNQFMPVTAVDTSTNEVTVVRNAFSSGDVEIASGATLAIVRAAEEGVRIRSSVTTDLAKRTNYIEEFETALEASWLQLGTEDLLEQDWPYQMRKKAYEHKRNKEVAFLLGRKGLRTGSNGKRVFYTGGLDWFIRTYSPADNVVNMNGGLMSKTSLENWIMKIKQEGDISQVVLLTSDFGWQAITSLADSYTVIPPNYKTLGVEITKVMVLGTTLNIAASALFPQLGIQDRIYAVNYSEMRRRPLRANGMNFTDKLLTDLQENDLKGRKAAFYAIEGFDAARPAAHGLYYGFVG